MRPKWTADAMPALNSYDFSPEPAMLSMAGVSTLYVDVERDIEVLLGDPSRSIEKY